MTTSKPQRRGARFEDQDVFPRPFGNYILLMPFARGGMGEVYLAKRGAILGAEKYCVLKKLRPELTRDREYVARFIDEARVVVQLSHANIAQVFDVGRVGSEYYLAMEYVSGRDTRSLQDRSREQGAPLSEPSVVYLLAETLGALDYAHRRQHPMTGEPLNLVHRDVSPQNVMVSFEGEVKLIDFGLASSRLKVERTQPNVVMGKMAYMAPEQARGDAIDPRADLFAAAVVGYELLVGERYYEGMTANDIWQVVGRGGFVPGRWGALNPRLAELLGRALHPSPEERFATCAELRDALMAYLHTEHPGRGERSLRELVQQLFAADISRERAMLAGFGEVSLELQAASSETTRSESISLAYAGPLSPPPNARVIHDERTQAASTDTQLPASSSDTGSDEAAPGHDETLLQDPPRAEPARRSRTPATGDFFAADVPKTLPVPESGPARPPQEDERTTVIPRSPTTVVTPRRSRVPALLASVGLLAALAGGAAAFILGQEPSGREEPLARLADSAPPVSPEPEPKPPVDQEEEPEQPLDDAEEPEPPLDQAEEPEPPLDEAEEPAAEVAAAEKRAEEKRAEERTAKRAAEKERLRARKQPKARAAGRRGARGSERPAKASQTAPEAAAPARPRESFQQQAVVVMRCELPGECSKDAIAPVYTHRYSYMSAGEKRSFEALIRRCRARCSR